MTEWQVTEKRILAVANVHISGQDVGNPSQVIVVQHDAFRITRRTRLCNLKKKTHYFVLFKKKRENTRK